MTDFAHLVRMMGDTAIPVCLLILFLVILTIEDFLRLRKMKKKMRDRDRKHESPKSPLVRK